MSAYMLELLFQAILLGDVRIVPFNNKSVLFLQEFNGQPDICIINDIGLDRMNIILSTPQYDDLATVCRADEVPDLIRAWRAMRTAKLLALGYPSKYGEQVCLLTESYVYPIPDGSLEWFLKRIR